MGPPSFLLFIYYFFTVYILLSFLLLSITVTATPTAITIANNNDLDLDFCDAHIYNYYFYSNANPDLAIKISSPEQAKIHWLTFGMKEGRQACGSFHSIQYLNRYEDLKKAFGSDYQAAIQHYLEKGIQEKRIGIDREGWAGRKTIMKNGIFISTSIDRMAGGIDSLEWDSFPFVNAWDHGRELQYALTNGSAECWNPTEAGSQDDCQKSTSSSSLLSLSLSTNQDIMYTSAIPAFWLSPNEKESQPSSICTVALNKQKRSTDILNKTIAIGYKEINNAIQMDATYRVNDKDSAAWKMVQIEGPTLYTNEQMVKFYMFDPSSGQLTPQPLQPPTEVPLPLIFSTADSMHAVGCYAPLSSSSLSSSSSSTLKEKDWDSIMYARFRFDLSPLQNTCSKWSIVFRRFRGILPSSSSVLTMKSFICVGTLVDVQTCLMQLHALHSQ
eukprot:TRINITY_DN7427_c0_g1_i1.p1 TRINITY_DN7427_c0_g1~~TRINITY_DN7427_c0_g1_i1.p1  ORF type:complete len:442 (+),score=106.78 TRINITY_DN7427_c0_g1_i1:52-1377(+)